MWGTERGTGLSFGANLKFCFFLYLFLLYNRAIEVFMKVHLYADLVSARGFSVT